MTRTSCVKCGYTLYGATKADLLKQIFERQAAMRCPQDPQHSHLYGVEEEAQKRRSEA